MLFGHQLKEGIIDVDGGSGSSPTSVVKYAIRKRNLYNAATEKNGLFPYKTVYCIMDVDDHNDIQKALEIIAIDNAKLKAANLPGELIPIISNECFELWYILHFMDYSTKPLHRPLKGFQQHNSQRLDKVLEKYLGDDYAKGAHGILSRLQKAKGDEKKAILNAKKLLAFHIEDLGLEADQLAYYNNPSTKVYQLVEHLNLLKERNKPAKVEVFSSMNLAFVRKKIKGHSPNNIRLLLSDKDDDFLHNIVDLINRFYTSDSLSRKIDLFLDIFEHPEANTASAEFPEKIGSFFYSKYYSWKKDVED